MIFMSDWSLGNMSRSMRNIQMTCVKGPLGVYVLDQHVTIKADTGSSV